MTCFALATLGGCRRASGLWTDGGVVAASALAGNFEPRAIAPNPSWLDFRKCLRVTACACFSKIFIEPAISIQIQTFEFDCGSIKSWPTLPASVKKLATCSIRL